MKKRKWSDSAIIKEAESKTTKSSKHYIMNNGMRKAVISSRNINYNDGKQWKEIDNTLKKVEDGYEATLGKYKAKLSSSGTESVEVSDGARGVSWTYLGAKDKALSNNKEKKPGGRTKHSKLKVTPKIVGAANIGKGSRATYCDADVNVDLDYCIEGNGIKENIIVKDIAEEYKYNFSLDTKGFEVRMSEDKRRIELYKVEEIGTDGDTPEFVMPAPFMYDADNNSSSDVHYELEKIEDGKHVFSVIASAKWINAPGRVFPVTIDPQLLPVTDSCISYLHVNMHKEHCYFENGYLYEGPWEEEYDYNRNYIYLYADLYDKTECNISIYKSMIDTGNNKIVSAKLNFTRRSNSGHVILNVNGKHNDTITSSENNISVDITDIYNNASNVAHVNLSLSPGELGFPLDSQDSCYWFRDGYGPSISFNPDFTLEIEYASTTDSVTRKSFTLAEGAETAMDIFTAHTVNVIDDISDPNLSLSVKHVHRGEGTSETYGNRFLLNIDEKLEKTSTNELGDDYVYTDSLGDKHVFKEVFYNKSESGKKTSLSVEKSQITVDTDGRLWSDGEEVFRELVSKNGLKATAKLEGFNDIEWLEQRADEEKQLEEQIKSYEDAICDFVVVAKDSGKYKKSIASAERYDNLVSCYSDEALLLTKSEATSYMSWICEKAELIESRKSVQEAIDSNKSKIDATITSISSSGCSGNCVNCSQRASCNANITGIHECENDEETGVCETCVKASIANAFNQMETLERELAYIGTSSDDETKTYNGCLTKFAIIANQKNLLVAKNAPNKETIEKYYKEYVNLKSRLAKLKLQLPVCYLKSENGAKGYNEQGNLAVIYDKRGNYVAFEREKYNENGDTRISAISDKDGNRMSFIYKDDGKLAEIVNSIGQRTEFAYNDGNLTSIKREQSTTLYLTYADEKISKISSSNMTCAQLTYGMVKNLKKIAYYSTAANITSTGYGATNALVNTVTISTASTKVTISDDSKRSEIYEINLDNEKITAQYKLIDGKVTEAQKYTYNDEGFVVRAESADKSLLNRHSYDTFKKKHFVAQSIMITEYDSFNKVTKEKKETRGGYWTEACPCDATLTVANYTYNPLDQLIKVRITRTESNEDCTGRSYTTMEKYSYNNMGEIIRRESYVDGEERISGINIEENVYDEKGNKTKSYTYNSLDSASKFYTENELDEQGRVSATLDSTGEHKTSYELEADGSVRTKKLPDGSKLSYGREKDGKITEITKSTEDGEENSNTKRYVVGEVTNLKSGNNTVEYTYDSKRRTTAVSLNGKKNYLTYTYAGDNTNDQTVTALLAGEVEFSKVTDLHGNVKRSTCADRSVENTYNEDNNLVKKVDSVSGTTEYSYNQDGQIEEVKAYNGAAFTENDYREVYSYSADGKLVRKTTVYNDNIRGYSYTYKNTAARELERITTGDIKISPKLDVNGRNVGKTISVNDTKVAEEQIHYLKHGDHATTMPSTVRYGNTANGKFVLMDSLKYRYDSMGNICEVLENGMTVARYEYDSIGRLTREDNKPFNKTTLFAYDNNGNIISKYIYSFTLKETALLTENSCSALNYSYDSASDRLLSYNGEAFEYDEIGNPTTYRGKSATWAYGRQLQSFDGNTYTYDPNARFTRAETNK